MLRVSFFRFVVFSLFFLCSFDFTSDLEWYFEKNYGYLKDVNEFRDSPTSLVSSSTATFRNVKNSVVVYYIDKQPDYSSIPLHYDLKKQNTSGAISYYVFEPSSTKDVKMYTLVDIVVLRSLYKQVLKELSMLGFVMGGEEMELNSDYIILFGWIDEVNFDRIVWINGVERVSFSDRSITAPLQDISITVKVPNNRDVVKFIESFSEKLLNYGFKNDEVKILTKDKKYRFMFIRFRGKLPIDKVKKIIESPFVVRIES